MVKWTGITVKEFMVSNHEIIKRVNQEALNIFCYSLSFNQLEVACDTYLQPGQNVNKCEPYKLTPDGENNVAV